METTKPPRRIHWGRNIARVRDAVEIKQETLAESLQKMRGEEWNQRKVSYMESKEDIDHDLLLQVAEALGVPVKAIENYDKETAINYFNTFNDINDNKGAINIGSTLNDCVFHPFDEYKDLVIKNEQLYQEIIKAKDAKIALLEAKVK
jgi:transcriptional regulator with XRE-family HTH domain